ncbi:MAG: hypothetical protein CSB55_05825 [Candidatus Cloacimonadota bacterium]|nr:MAG: hypothetical protein CSB55_05825 [Candidatus Cloacimonadota bacterium]
MSANNKSRAEKIIEYDPNGLVVVDKNNCIIQVNKAFLHIFQIDVTEKIVGKNVNDVLGQDIFSSTDIAKDKGKIKHHFRTGKVVQLISFSLCDEDCLSACFFVDITQHFHSKRRLQEMKRETIEKAHKVINKQMRVAQEIASLLGETTAETKSTLYNLLKIIDEEEEINE